MARCTQFLAAIGTAWTAREEAVTLFARWPGFARTGPVIVEISRSLINGLIRQGRVGRNAAAEIRRMLR